MSVADWRSLYPFQSRFAEIDGHRYHYVDEGTGEVVLMVHGNPTWSFYYRNLVRGLRDRYRCVAVDHLGCGLSDKPQVYPYSLARHTQNLVEFIRRHDWDRITMVGHDWGGAIGLGAAVALPELVSRLVLFNTGAFPPPRVPRRIALCRLPILGNLGLRGLNVFSRAAMHMATSLPAGLPADVQAGLLAPYDTWAHRVGVARFVQDIPLTPSHPTYAVLEQLEENLSRLTHCAVQFIWGMRDWCFDIRCLDRLSSHFPAARVLRLSDAGHWVVEDQPEKVLATVSDFLDQTT